MRDAEKPCSIIKANLSWRNDNVSDDNTAMRQKVFIIIMIPVPQHNKKYLPKCVMQCLLYTEILRQQQQEQRQHNTKNLLYFYLLPLFSRREFDVR